MSQPTSPERIGIVGSGAIATGLARVAAESGEVVLWARSEASAKRASASLEGAAPVVTQLEALRDSSVVVEAVAEDIAVKRQVHARLGELLPEPVLMATTTSSLSVAEIAEAGGRPDRFAGLHVFNPVEKMDLVELAFPDQASEDVRRRFRELCEQLGKIVVEVPDVPGFVVNRLLFPYLFDAVELAERSGLEPKALDTCMKLGAGHPMGPLRLLDFVGLDVAVAIAESIDVEVPARVREMIAAGRLGRKSGAGFYVYE
ncbi:MAG: 3-hydroxyacyl-CoA dehydrogenase family protein [Thermoleophilaceae bacterium]|nr:3-hydroxyacyl-CoA dehydrogenase family protein [Thermoleophilaceae bacterium]